MLREIGNLLQTQNLGTLGQDIFLALLPDEPDECVTLYEYAGSPPDLHWNGHYPGLQVRVRGVTYASARTRIASIESALHGLYEQVLSGLDKVEEEDDTDDTENGEVEGTRYLLIRAAGSPELLRRDSRDRVELIQNYMVIKEG